MLWASARCKSQFGLARRGSARHGMAGWGGVRQGKARRNEGCRRQHGGATLPAALYGSSQGTAVLGQASFGMARHGMVRPGVARAIDDGTEALRFPAILTRMVAASFGVVG